jgi:hypothetical protein
LRISNITYCFFNNKPDGAKLAFFGQSIPFFLPFFTLTPLPPGTGTPDQPCRKRHGNPFLATRKGLQGD